MAALRDKLSKNKLKALKPGQSVTQKGICFERLHNGDGRFSINKMIDGQRIHRVIGLESDGLTLLQVEEALAKLATDARAQRLSLPERRKLAMRIGEAAPLYLQRLEQEEGKNRERKAFQLKRHLLPFFKNMAMANLTGSDVNRYRKKRKDTGAKPATVNRELATLSHLLSKAVEWGWIPHRPCMIKMEPEDNRKLTFLTKEQCQLALNAAREDSNPQIYLFIRIGLETGMRRSEILTIRLENINLEQGFIYLPKAKAGARNQPIGAKLSETIKQYIQEQGITGPWLFPSNGKKTSKYGYSSSIEQPFRRVMAQAGLDPKVITPHTLRHTAVTHLVQAGVDWTTIMAISGHKTLSMVQRYSHQASPHIQDALDTLHKNIHDEDNERSGEITQELHRGLSDAFVKNLQTLSRLEEKQEIENYPQGNSNPCRLREREVS